MVLHNARSPRTPALTTLTLALLALGCGGGHPLGPAGAAGAGGMLGTGGALGTGVFFTVGCPLDFTPCGGSLLGTWRSDPKCKPMAPTQVPSACQSETWDLDGVVTTATWTFAADQTFTIDISTEGTATVMAPQACLVDGAGRQLSCDGSDVGAMYANRLFFTGGTPGAPTCEAPPAACACTIPYVPAPLILSGTYSTSGTTLTLSLPGGLAGLSADYCVAGNVLDLAGQSSLIPKGDFLRQ